MLRRDRCSAQILKLAETLQTREPRMIRWLAERPLAALASESLLPQLLT